MAAEPVPYDSSCDECDLCCVLQKETKTVTVDGVDFDCDMLYWLCKCPGGTLMMQRQVEGVWTDVATWTEDGEGYWYPPPFLIGGTGTQYRLKCTIAEGLASELAYYSNSVQVDRNDLIADPCNCNNEGTLNKLQIEIDVDTENLSAGTPFGAFGAPTGSYTLVFDVGGCIQVGANCVKFWWGLNFESYLTELTSGMQLTLVLDGNGSGTDRDAGISDPSLSEWYATMPFGSPPTCKRIYSCDTVITMDTSGGDHPEYHFWAFDSIWYYMGSSTVTAVRLSLATC